MPPHRFAVVDTRTGILVGSGEGQLSAWADAREKTQALGIERPDEGDFHIAIAPEGHHWQADREGQAVEVADFPKLTEDPHEVARQRDRLLSAFSDIYTEACKESPDVNTIRSLVAKGLKL